MAFKKNRKGIIGSIVGWWHTSLENSPKNNITEKNREKKGIIEILNIIKQKGGAGWVYGCKKKDSF